MNIDIYNLKDGINNKRNFSFKYKFTKEELKNTNIISLDDLYVKGYIYQSNYNYFIDMDISGTMVLPCDITLKPTKVPFKTNVSGNLEELFDEYELKYEKNEKTIDIFDIIWENILMEIPLKVVNPDISDRLMQGDGWDIVTSDERVNPNLAKLNDLLGGVKDGSTSKKS